MNRQVVFKGKLITVCYFLDLDIILSLSSVFVTLEYSVILGMTLSRLTKQNSFREKTYGDWLRMKPTGG